MKVELVNILVALLLLLTAARARAQSTDYVYRGIPATIEELDLAFDLKGRFTGQVDLQTVTQGAYLGVNSNPSRTGSARTFGRGFSTTNRKTYCLPFQ